MICVIIIGLFDGLVWDVLLECYFDLDDRCWVNVCFIVVGEVFVV